jgi:hypothetical protein
MEVAAAHSVIKVGLTDIFEEKLALHILAQPEHSFWINLNTYSDLT